MSKTRTLFILLISLSAMGYARIVHVAPPPLGATSGNGSSGAPYDSVKRGIAEAVALDIMPRKEVNLLPADSRGLVMVAILSTTSRNAPGELRPRIPRNIFLHQPSHIIDGGKDSGHARSVSI